MNVGWKRSTLLTVSILLLCSAATLPAASKPTPKLSRAEAEKIALNKEPGTIANGELEKEHGRWIYSFDVRTASGVREVNVDANKGNIVEDTVESAKDEAKEKKAEAVKPKN